VSRLSYPEQILDDDSRICGKGGTIRFFKGGKVAVEMSWPFFEAQSKKLISHFKGDPKLQILLEHLNNPCNSSSGELTSMLLGKLIQIREQSEFDRSLDTFVSSIRAVRELWLKTVPLKTEKFISAVGKLARQHQRPPTKAELTNHLCLEPAETSRLCKEHGFAWLPNAAGGRPPKRRPRKRLA
jgi:hypothetical protein